MLSKTMIEVSGEADNIRYSIVASSSDSESGQSESSNENEIENDGSRGSLESDEKKQQEEYVPFAELMRRKKLKKETDSKVTSLENTDINIDDEIKRLEAELATDQSSDDDEDDDYTSDKMTGIISLSIVASERIPSLPQSALPLLQKSKRLKVDRNMDGEDRPQKRAREKANVSNGLKETVREMLGNYVPRSSQRLPFYCRVCSQQLSNYEEFRDHKKTEFHKVAVQEEQKASFCRLCRKQFTSPAQLKEHLKARPHKEKLAYEKAKQSQRTAESSSGIQGDGYSGTSGDRQWC